MIAEERRRLVSLGSTCHIAQFLKDANRKPESTPFDWIFSTPQAVEHMLSDDFACFLDASQYVDHREQEEGPRRAGHARYHDRMFNHHDPRAPEDHAYFARCVDRFRALNAAPRVPLFILGHMNQRRAAASKVHERISDLLQQRVPGAALLVIHHVPDGEAAAITELVSRPLLRVVQMSGSRSDGRHFASAADDERLRQLVLAAEEHL